MNELAYDNWSVHANPKGAQAAWGADQKPF
jgi:hypothetical protein